MRRTLTAAIVSASVLLGTAQAQDLAPPARAQAEKAEHAEQAARADLEKAQADRARQQERLAIDAARIEEVQRAKAQVDVFEGAAKLRLAQQQRLLAEQSLIGARRVRIAQARQVKKETVAYCGVSISEPPAVVTAQLKLAAGTGLVVDLVVEKSPAETAGVKQHDVITKLDDQVLTNAEQFRALVRMKKPSDDVKLSIVRRGEPVTVGVQLGQQEIEEAVGQGDVPDPNLQQFEMALGLAPDGQLDVAPQIVDFNVGGGGGMAVTNFNGKNQAVWSDEKHVLTMELKGGKAVTLSAKDPAGKQLFDGPVETEDQRKVLAPDIAATLKKAEAGGQFGFKMNAAAPGGNRPRVLTSNDKDTLLLARVESGKATYAFAFSEADGKTLFDGPVDTEAQRKTLPEAVAKQIDTLEKNLSVATEFGVIGRN